MLDPDSEKRWEDARVKNGWVMPRAAWWKRLLPVRRVRAAWLDYQASKYAMAWATVGIGLGRMNPYDAWVIYGIATGRERPLWG